MISIQEPDTVLRADIGARLDDVPYRTPIVDNYNPAIYDPRPGEDAWEAHDRARDHEEAIDARNAVVDRQWRAVTEVARRAILADPEARRVAARLVGEPLDESLPVRAVTEIAKVDERTARFIKLTGKKLGTLLELEPVPDELLVPDIRHASGLARKEDDVQSLFYATELGEEYFESRLEDAKHRVVRSPGITGAERVLVARRYRYARDVKLLGLMAELHDQPIEDPESKDGLVTHQLQSGAKLVMTAEAFEAKSELLNPEHWEARKQLKDRVHIITVDGKQYVMKERKTPRHTDVKKGGHIDGLTSEQEFETASMFAGFGTIRRDDLELRWETPLGYVEFPDGYQFCVFEVESGFLDGASASYRLQKAIMESPEEYSEEYERTATEARALFREREDLITAGFADMQPRTGRFAVSRKKRAARKAAKEQPAQDELTFAEFARAKARIMEDLARDLLKDTMLEKGFTNSDSDGYEFRVVGDDRPVLQIVGFDFEYYKLEPAQARRIQSNIAKSNQNGERIRMYASGFFNEERSILKAAKYALLERAGYTLPTRKEQV